MYPDKEKKQEVSENWTSSRTLSEAEFLEKFKQKGHTDEMILLNDR